MTRAKRKNRRKQTRRRNHKKRGGMFKRALPALGKGLPLAPRAGQATIFNFINSSQVSPGAMPTGAMPTGAMRPTVTVRPTVMTTTGAMPTGATTTGEIPTSGLVPTTAEDVLKFMKDNNITIEDLQKITDNEKIVKTTEQAVEQAFVNQGSVDWKEMREMQNQAYQAFNKTNVFTHAWKKFVEDECKTRSSEEQDKCFAIRGFVYVSFMVFLIILKMVDSHNKKVKISDSELVNVANTVVSGLVVDRILPSQLQNVITERVNQLLLKQKIIDKQVKDALEQIN